MFAKALESVLPGLRDFRTPFVAGLLWSAFIWMSWGPSIESQIGADHRAQLVRLGERLPVTVTIALVSVAVYVLGVVAEWLTWRLARVTGASIDKAQRWRLWLVHCRRWLKTTARQLDALPAEGPQQDELRAKYNTVVKSGRIVPRRRPRVIAAVGGAPLWRGSRAEEVASDAIDAAGEVGWAEGLSDGAVDLETRYPQVSYTWTRRFLQDLDPDPLDAVYTADPGFYQVLDRERSEREFLAAVTPPIMAACVLLAVTWSPWALLGGLLPLGAFLYAAMQLDPTVRVIRFLARTGSADAIKSARLVGRQQGIAAARSNGTP